MSKKNQVASLDVGKNEFLNLKVNVFRNKKNGQMSLTLPKKILKDIPKKIDIKLPFKYFKIIERGDK